MGRTLFTLEQAEVIHVQDPAELAMQNDIAENSLNQETNVISEVANECNNQLDGLQELNSQTDEQVDLITNKPEQITEETVQVAQENFVFTLARLGYTKEQLNEYRLEKSYRMSFESNHSPIHKLKLTTEGIKEFIMRIIQKVKDMFIKFGAMLKKFVLKLTKLFDLTKQRAQYLLEKVNKDAKYTIDGDSLNYLNDMFIGMQVINSSNKDGTLEIEKGNEYIKSFVTWMANIANSAGTQLDKPVGKGGIVRWLLSTAGDVFGSFFKTKDPSNDVDDIPIRFMNQNIKVLRFKPDSNIMEIASKSVDFPNLRPFTIDGNKLKSYLNIAFQNASNIRQFEGSLQNIVKNADTTVKRTEEKVKLTKQEAHTEVVVALNVLGRLSTSIIVEVTSNYVDYNKAIVQLGSMLISTGTPDNEEELKKKAKEEKEKKK